MANKNYVIISGTTLIIGDTNFMFVISFINETNRFDMSYELNCSKKIHIHQNVCLNCSAILIYVY